MPQSPGHISEHTLLLARALTTPSTASSSPPNGGPQLDTTIPVDRLETAERLLLSGELLSSLSHEVNNVLTALLGSVELLQFEDLPPSATELTSTIITVGNHLKGLLRSMLFMAQGSARENRCELSRLVNTATVLMMPLARDHRVVIESECDEALYVPLLPHQVLQILLNLMINSVQAMTSGGKITVSARACKGDALLIIRDTGPGIPPTVRERMFEPFFSTKPSDASSGLGLAIVRSVLTQAGGSITLTDARPGCTTFTIRLPRVMQLPVPVSLSGQPSSSANAAHP